MKKRPIIFGILLILSIIFMIVHSCKAKAASAVDVTPDPMYNLPEWSFAPVTPSPEPTATPAPGASETAAPAPEERGLDIDLQPTYIYTRQYKTTWNPTNQVNYSGYTYVLFNDNGTASVTGTDVWNFSNPSRGGHLQVTLDDDWNDVPITDFTHLLTLDYTAVGATSVNFKYSSYVYAFTDVPQVDLLGDFNITYSIKVPMFNKVTIPSGAENIYSLLGINDSSIKYANVFTYITVHGSSGTTIPYTFQHTLSDLIKGMADTISVVDLSSTETISYIDIMYEILPFGFSNFYDSLEAAFAEAGQTPSSASMYGSWLLNGQPVFFQRTVKYTESRNLFEKILAGIKSLFVPDPDVLRDTIMSIVPNTWDGSAGYAFNLRNIIWGLFESEPDAVIHVPKFLFPASGTYAGTSWINGEYVRSYVVWDSYSVNITEYISNSRTLSKIQTYVRYIIDLVITFAFMNSLFAIVASVFGLHWYKGVEAEDIGESEV